MKPVYLKVRDYLLKCAYDRRVAPRREDLAHRISSSRSAVDRALKYLREAGDLQTHYREDGSIRFYEIRIGKVWRATREGKAPLGRPSPKPGEYGDGPIARMTDRDKAEEKIAEIFAGRKFESYRFRHDL